MVIITIAYKSDSTVGFLACRVSHEQWQMENEDFIEASNKLSADVKVIGEGLQSLSHIPFFRQAKQHQTDKLKVTVVTVRLLQCCMQHN